jgi:hypothetical protein
MTLSSLFHQVLSQPQRKLIDLNRTLETSRFDIVSLKTKADIVSLETKAVSLENQRRCKLKHYGDPLPSWKGQLAKDSVLGGNGSLRMHIGILSSRVRSDAG